jgi:hypothetical protein
LSLADKPGVTLPVSLALKHAVTLGRTLDLALGRRLGQELAGRRSLPR